MAAIRDCSSAKAWLSPTAAGTPMDPESAIPAGTTALMNVSRSEYPRDFSMTERSA